MEAIHAAIDVRTTEFDNITGRIAVLQKAEAATADQISAEVKQISRRMAELEQLHRLDEVEPPSDHKVYLLARQRLEAIKGDLLSAISALPENSDRRFSRDNLAQYRAQASQLEANILRMGQEMARVEANLTHLEIGRAHV